MQENNIENSAIGKGTQILFAKDKVNGMLNLASGELILGFYDFDFGDGSPFDIRHIHTCRGNERSWKLNLYETVSVCEGETDKDPIYTDCYGERMVFKERSYYIGSYEKKSVVASKDILTDKKGNLYTYAGGRKEVVREYVTRAGWRLTLCGKKRGRPCPYFDTAIYCISDTEGNRRYFDKCGNLCGIIDKDENRLAVIWNYHVQESGRIVGAVYNDKKATFKYDESGDLKSAWLDKNKRAVYEYSDGRLCSVTFFDRRKIAFGYGHSDRLAHTDFGIRVEFEYEDGKLAGVGSKPGKKAKKNSAKADEIKVDVRHYDGYVCIKCCGVVKTFFVGDDSQVYAVYSRDRLGDPVERLSLRYLSQRGEWGYSVCESAPSVWENDTVYYPSEKPVCTITADMLPFGAVEYVFSARSRLKSGTSEPNRGLSFQAPFKYVDFREGVRYELRAVVRYKDSREEFNVSLDTTTGVRYAALPLSLNEKKYSDLAGIDLYVDGPPSATFDFLEFAPSEWEYREYDMFGRLTRKREGKRMLCSADGSAAYETKASSYLYAGDRIAKKRTETVFGGLGRAESVDITEYIYDADGNVSEHKIKDRANGYVTAVAK